MLEFKNVSFSYGLPVLRGISFALSPGCVTCLLSPNAGGKSTLLKLAAGFLRTQGGEVLWEEQSVGRMKPKRRACQMAFLPQQTAVPELTVRELVSHGRYPHLSNGRVLSPRDKEIIERAMETTGTAGYADRRLTELSGGQRQKAALAMVVAQDTPLLLLDEPTTYLDIRVQLELTDILRTLAGHGKSVLLALHDISLALSRCERAIVLQDGKIVYDGGVDNLSHSGVIAEVFGVSGIEKSRAFLNTPQ